MKILLTVGDPYSGYHGVHQLLVAAGLAEAIPSLQDGMSAEVFCDKVVGANEVTGGSGWVGQCQPGRFWENQLGELLMANLDQHRWGWANSNALHLLDWLASFDPQFCFVLSYCSPVSAIGRKLKGQLSGHEEITSAISDWLDRNGELLRFYFRHRERCVLVNSSAARLAQQDLLSKLNSAFDLTLALDNECNFFVDEREEMTSLLTRELLAEREDVHLLFQELESSADLGASPDDEQYVTAAQAWSEYVTLLGERSAYCESEQRYKEQLNAAFAEQQASVVSLAESKEEVRRLAIELGGMHNLLSERQQQVSELVLDNDRLAEQIRSEREAFAAERLFRMQLENSLEQSAETQRNLEKALIDVRSGALDEIAMLRREIDDARRENASLREALTVNGALQEQLSGLQLELESSVVASKALEQSLARIADEKISLEKQLLDTVSRLDAAERDLGRLADEKIWFEKQRLEDIRQLEVAAQNGAQSALKLDELGKERESLLLQINQMQVNLECSLSSRKSLEEQLNSLKKEKLAAHQQLRELESRLATSGEQVDRLVIAKQSLEKQANDAARAVTDLQKQLEQLLEEKELLARQLEELRQRLEAAVQQARALTEADKENESLLLQLHTLQEELERNFLAAKAMEQRFESLERDKTDACKQLNDAKGQLQASTKQLEQVVKARQFAEKQLKDSAAQVADLKKQLESLNREKDASDKQAGDLRRQVAEVEKARQVAERLAKETAQEVDVLRKKIEQETRGPAKKQQESEQRLGELTRENDLLLVQLHQVQEELEHYFLMTQGGRGGNTAATPVAALDSTLVREIVFDMRKDIEGDNWYHAETDGRWAGPGAQSTIMLPILPPGEYRLEFDVVDAMTPDILLGTEVLLNGISLHAECDWVGYPAVLRCTFSNRGSAAQDRPELALKFPYLVSPAESGSDDHRLLAIRLRSIRCERLDQN